MRLRGRCCVLGLCCGLLACQTQAEKDTEREFGRCQLVQRQAHRTKEPEQQLKTYASAIKLCEAAGKGQGPAAQDAVKLAKQLQKQHAKHTLAFDEETERVALYERSTIVTFPTTACASKVKDAPKFGTGAICGPNGHGWGMSYPKSGSPALAQLRKDCAKFAGRGGYVKQSPGGHVVDNYGPPVTLQITDPDYVADEFLYCRK